MEVKFKTLCITIVSMFITGMGLIFLGAIKGSAIAVELSRPRGATGWSTSGELIDACTYIPIGIGCFLLLLALVFSAITFIKFVEIK